MHACIALQDEESEYNEEENILHQSNTDVSLVTSEEGQSQIIKWNMGPYLKEILVKFQEGETILKKQEKRKRTKKK